jgi:hypothetical protein
MRSQVVATKLSRALMRSSQPPIGRLGRQRSPFRRLAEKVELRRHHQVGKAYGVAGEILLAAQKTRQFVEHRVCLGHRIRDCAFITRLAQQARPDDALKPDDVGDTLKQVPVADIHDLIHQRGPLRRARCQRRRGQDAIEIPQDRLRFVEHQIAVLEHRHAPERMPQQMRLAFRGLGRNRRKPIVRALFFESSEHGAAIRAAGHAMNNELRHREPPASNVITSWVPHPASGCLAPDPSSARSAPAGVSVRISRSSVRRFHGSGPD